VQLLYAKILLIPLSRKSLIRAKFESKSDAESYLKLYKDRLNKKLMVVHDRAKTRGIYKIFELDSKSATEINKRKYGLNY
jgi:hypothetical protein